MRLFVASSLCLAAVACATGDDLPPGARSLGEVDHRLDLREGVWLEPAPPGTSPTMSAEEAFALVQGERLPNGATAEVVFGSYFDEIRRSGDGEGGEPSAWGLPVWLVIRHGPCSAPITQPVSGPVVCDTVFVMDDLAQASLWVSEVASPTGP